VKRRRPKPKPRKGVLPPQELFQIKDLGRLLLKVSAHNGYLILVHFSPNLFGYRNFRDKKREKRGDEGLRQRE
jgi:hypothetical protein